MKKVLRIEEAYLYLPLNASELSSVLDDAKGCVDLLQPHIVIEDNCIRFRHEDIKMLQPELFFCKGDVKFELSLNDILVYVATTIFWTIVYLLGVNLITEGVDLGNVISLLTPLLIINTIAFYHYVMGSLIKKRRKALYIKARLLSYLYIIVNTDVTTTNERLERTTKRLESDYSKVKQMTKQLVNAAPESIREQLRDMQYPDGDNVIDDIGMKTGKLS